MPDTASMRASGYEPEDFEGESVEVWPENWQAMELFTSLETQWCAGFGGVTGLNYLVAFAIIDRMKLDQIEADYLFADLQVMERSALKEMRNNV